MDASLRNIMFSKRKEEVSLSRFESASEFHKIAAQLNKLKAKNNTLRADHEKDSVSAGAVKYHVVSKLLKDIDNEISRFNSVQPREEDAELFAKSALCKQLTSFVKKTTSESWSVLEMRRGHSGVLESTARMGVNIGAAIAWFVSPLSFYGGGVVAAVAAKYLGDNVVANYEDYPNKNTDTQNILEELDKELSAAVMALSIATGECKEVDPTFFDAAPPRP